MFEPEEKKDDIDKIKDSLYSRNTDAIFVKRRHSLQETPDLETPTAWNVKDEKAESSFKLPYTKILLGAFIFFVLALIFTFSRFFLGNNVVSGNNIDILVSGPVSIAGGEVLPLDIQIKNNNNIGLQVADLHIVYPDGTKSATDQSTDLKNFSQVLGDISAGQNKEILTKSILFGEENSQRTVQITVEYRIAGSNAVFSKEKDFNVLISSSPVNMIVSNPTQVNTNQLVNFSVEVDSNSTSIVKNLILKVDYPFGFSFSSSNPNPSSSGSNIFHLGDLAPGEKRTIRISGIIAGQDSEQRVFNFTVGNPNSNDDTVIQTALASYTSTISLSKSSIGLDLSLNDQTGDNIAINAGDKNIVNIDWVNNLAEQVYNMSINVKITGQSLDQQSVNVEKGFYNSADNSIVFDKSNNPDFATVAPSDGGNLRFDFSTLFPSTAPSVSFGNSTANLNITVTGNRAGGSGSSAEVLYSGTKTLKISSDLNLLSRGFRTVGPFENSGPFPPQVDNQTTYTITWTASDSFNNITSAKVSAFLPPNVTWTGYTTPSTEDITYNKGTGEVDWNIGDMKSGVGTNSAPREVSFQVAITPSITQVGTEINLLNEATISGTDVFSGARVGEVKNPITTNITSDPAYVDDIGKVVR